jgi:hypothetical protein
MTPLPVEYREIPLDKGQTTRVTVDDFMRFGHRSWWAHWDKNTKSYYAVGKRKFPDGKWRGVKLHREILGLELGDKRQADHIDHDTLNNIYTDDPKTNNLRIATSSQNSINRRNRSDNTSGFKGVAYYALYGKWRARIMVAGKSKFLGYFETAELAYEARRKANDSYHGVFSCKG